MPLDRVAGAETAREQVCQAISCPSTYALPPLFPQVAATFNLRYYAFAVPLNTSAMRRQLGNRMLIYNDSPAYRKLYDSYFTSSNGTGREGAVTGGRGDGGREEGEFAR